MISTVNADDELELELDIFSEVYRSTASAAGISQSFCHQSIYAKYDSVEIKSRMRCKIL